MKNNLTELVFILDESGSMANLTDDTIGGFNSLIDKQKTEEGEAYVSTVMFSGETKVIHDRVPIEKVEHLTRKDYVPSGCTALLDAVGGAIHHIGNVHKYAREEDIPEKTMFIITTDGMENASRRYSLAKVKKMIEHEQKEYGWEFIFLGANIDAAETAASMGIVQENAVNYHADVVGTSVMFESLSRAVSGVRNSRMLNETWKDNITEDDERRKRFKK